MCEIAITSRTPKKGFIQAHCNHVSKVITHTHRTPILEIFSQAHAQVQPRIASVCTLTFPTQSLAITATLFKVSFSRLFIIKMTKGVKIIYFSWIHFQICWLFALQNQSMLMQIFKFSTGPWSILWIHSCKLFNQFLWHLFKITILRTVLHFLLNNNVHE